eukprot:3541995-Lingulodinium_polyedra.AAC.1
MVITARARVFPKQSHSHRSMNAARPLNLGSRRAGRGGSQRAVAPPCPEWSKGEAGVAPKATG